MKILISLKLIESLDQPIDLIKVLSKWAAAALLHVLLSDIVCTASGIRDKIRDKQRYREFRQLPLCNLLWVALLLFFFFFKGNRLT